MPPEVPPKNSDSLTSFKELAGHRGDYMAKHSFAFSRRGYPGST